MPTSTATLIISGKMLRRSSIVTTIASAPLGARLQTAGGVRASRPPCDDFAGSDHEFFQA